MIFFDCDQQFTVKDHLVLFLYRNHDFFLTLQLAIAYMCISCSGVCKVGHELLTYLVYWVSIQLVLPLITSDKEVMFHLAHVCLSFH